MGLVIFLVGAVRTILALLQDFDYTREHLGAIAAFLDTGLGNAVVMVLGVVLVLWAIYRRRTESISPKVKPEPESTTRSHLVPADDGSQQTVDWKALRFGIPTTEDAQDALMRLLAENARATSPDPVIELLAESERIRDHLTAERDEARAERDALKQELNEVKQAFDSQEDLPDDEELKQRSSELSEELFRFLEERAEKAPRTGIFSKEKRYHDGETRKQYGRQYSGEVTALLNALGRRGWLTSEEQKKLRSAFKTIDDRIRLTAECLAAIGRRL